MLLACKVVVRVTERARTTYLSMLVVCLCIRLCIRLIYVKINSFVCVNLYKYTLIKKKEKHLASPYVYVNLMQQCCQINDNSTQNAFGAYSNLLSSHTKTRLGLQKFPNHY